MKSSGAERLARFVYERRSELQLAQGDLKARGGPSVVTVGLIERGQIANPHGPTLTKLDRALRWKDGSAARVLAGGEPDVKPEPHERVVVLDHLPEVVGLGLDDEAEGLTPEEIQPVLDQIRLMKKLKGLQ